MKQIQINEGIPVDPSAYGLPVLCQPKDGAVESTFTEQSLTLSHPPVPA